MAEVILQADINGMPVMPIAPYETAHMRVPNLAQFTAADDGTGIETELADPRWLLDIVTAPLDYHDHMRMEGWTGRVRTISAGRFYGFDPRRRRPRAYSQDVVPPAPTLGAAIPANPPRLVTLAGLPAGYQLSAGDHIGYTASNNVRSVHRLVADATANGAGVAIVSVLPRILLAAPAGSAVSLDRPLVLMHMLPGSIETPINQVGTVAFKAVSINRVLTYI
jgi:hypothetical protein